MDGFVGNSSSTEHVTVQVKKLIGCLNEKKCQKTEKGLKFNS